MSTAKVQRPENRGIDELRPTRLETGVLKFAEGSALLELGDTQVLVAASVEERVPGFLKDSSQGWVTGEYAMLPRATPTRSQRESSRGRPAGRSQEIQRLIGRSLRAAVDLRALGERTVTIDCDVLQADGGTRTAAVTGGYVALCEALGKLFLAGDLSRWPVVRQLAAVSVGIVDGTPLLDLEYAEDSIAEVDLNVVATHEGELVEVQGTGESRSFRREELQRLLDLAEQGIAQLVGVQDAVLSRLREEVASIERSGRRQTPPRDEKELWGPPG